MTTSSTPLEQRQQRPAHVQKRAHFSAGFITAVILLLLIGAVGGWLAGWFKPRPTIALVTNNADPFWDPVIAGARDAAEEHHLKLKVVKGNGDSEAQSKAVRELMDQNVRGLGISPIDPSRQTIVLRQAAMKMPLVTFDSDCPDSGRLWFVGTDNYAAGRQCGNMVRDALPDGGDLPHVRWARLQLICASNASGLRQRRVPPPAVVPALDPLEHARPRLGPRAVTYPVHQLALQAAEEALGHRVVVAVARPAHAARDAMLRQQRAV